MRLISSHLPLWLTTAALALTLGTTACSQLDDSGDAEHATFLSATPSSLKADGDDGGVDALTERAVLELANTADFTLLDDAVGLDRRAARNIVDARIGDDHVLFTADDRTIDTLAQLDAISYVGPTAFRLLSGYALANGYGDGGDDPDDCTDDHVDGDNTPPTLDPNPSGYNDPTRGCDVELFGTCYYGDALELPGHGTRPQFIGVNASGALHISGEGERVASGPSFISATMAPGDAHFNVVSHSSQPGDQAYGIQLFERLNGDHVALHARQTLGAPGTLYVDNDEVCDGAWTDDNADIAGALATYTSDGTLWVTVATLFPMGGIEVCFKREGESHWNRELVRRGAASTTQAGYDTAGWPLGLVEVQGQLELVVHKTASQGGGREVHSFRRGGAGWQTVPRSVPNDWCKTSSMFQAHNRVYMVASVCGAPNFRLYEMTSTSFIHRASLCNGTNPYACTYKGFIAGPDGSVVLAWNHNAHPDQLLLGKYLNGSVTIGQLGPLSLPSGWLAEPAAIASGPYGGLYFVRALLDGTYDVLRYLPTVE